MPPRCRALLDTLATSRRFESCENVLHRAGEYCVDAWSEGIISEGQLRTLNVRSAWRVMQGYIALLVDCGAFEDIGDRRYRIAHFLDTNRPNIERLAWEENYLAKGRERSRRSRRRHGLMVVQADVESTSDQQNEAPQVIENMDDCLARNAERTRSTTVSCSSNSSAKKHTAVDSKTLAKVAPAVGSHKRRHNSAVVETYSDTTDEEFAAMIAKAASRGRSSPDKEAETLAVARPEVAEGDLQAPAVPSFEVEDKPQQSGSPSFRRGSKAPNPDYDPAPIPVDPTPVNLGDCTKALRIAQKEQPSPSHAALLHQKLGAIAARQVELDYAMNRLAAQRNKGVPVLHPVPWIHGVIIRQREHRERQAEMD